MDVTLSDDLFLWQSPLTEGKALGSVPLRNVTLARNYYNVPGVVMGKSVPQPGHIIAVSKGKLGEVQQRFKANAMRLIKEYQAWKLPEFKFRIEMVLESKRAIRDAFLAGLRAGGTPAESAGKGKTVVHGLDPSDEAWLVSATAHEMRFLNRMVEAITTGDFSMPLERRVGMYADTLDSVFNSARVISLPQNTLFRWTGPDDKKTCEGCRYLFEQSPFTKNTIPTTPRACMTSCKTNCRDRLFVYKAGLDEVQQAETVSREVHMTRLRSLLRKRR